MGQGYIHVYTGDGKGKTTAALGLALRAAGAAKKVYIAQFVKGMKYSELDSLKKHYPEIEVRQFGLECFIKKIPTKEDIEAARQGLNIVSEIIRRGEHDVLILDESCIALHYQLFTIEEFLRVLRNRPGPMEIIITGRYCPQEIIDAADLVTEMREVKHYFQKGVKARKGIEY
jgi:cob(I)alamin adenosyltransferase